MGLIILLSFAIVITGCAGLGQDQTVESDPTELERQEGMKNLAAIKDIMVSSPKQSHSPSSGGMPDYHQEKKLGEKNLESVVPQVNETERGLPLSLFMTPKREPSRSRPLRINPPLIMPQNYASDARLLNPPLTPPYTFFAPTGSAYPGSIRCVPDYLGGSRCSVYP
jgi:hypothetical protein